MDAKPIHTFEIAGAKGGLKSIFSGRPSLCLHESGISWPEGSLKKFIEFSKVTSMKYSKYYAVLTIAHTANGAPETKKINLVNVSMFATIWQDFARKFNIEIALKAE